MDNKFNSVESKLTPAAREALEELLTDIRRQLLSNAEKMAYSASGEIREITVRDVFKSFELFGMKHKDEKYEQIKIISISLIFVGLLAVVISLFLAVNKTIFENWVLPYIFGITIISAGAVFFMRYRQLVHKVRREWEADNITNQGDYSMILVNRWQEFELELRSFVSNNFGESQADTPISKSIRLLIDKNVISLSEGKILVDALRKRNEILHEGQELSRSTAYQIEKDLGNIMNKIKRENKVI